MEGLESVNARVIWKVTLEEVMAVDMGTRTLSSMLFLSSFEDDALLLDQLPISLLITAGDYTSIQDAASKSIPILGLPWTAEQVGILAKSMGNKITSVVVCIVGSNECNCSYWCRDSYSIS